MRAARTLLARLVLGVVAAVLLTAAAPAPGTPPPPTSSPMGTVNPVLLNAPAYRPPADPESMSVVIGRRLGAPRVKESFTGGTRSLDDLGRAVCHAIHHSDRDSLVALCVTDREFSKIMWREFPQSRPITGLQWDDAYFVLDRRNGGGAGRAIQMHGGTHLRFVRWERTDTTAVYRNFRLHNGLVLVALDENGQETRLDVVRAAAERGGRFKLYALKD
jgi:hypothetical protein